MGKGTREIVAKKPENPPRLIMASRRFAILPGRGLGDIRFGISADDLKQIVGNPWTTDQFDDAGEVTVLLSYPGMGLFFHEGDAFRLSTIEVDSECPCHLFGSRLFPMNRSQLLGLLRRNLSETELTLIEESVDDEIGESSLNLPSLWITFYFGERGELDSVNWSVIVDSNDEVLWPQE